MISDLLNDAATENNPGLVALYVALKSDVLTWPALPGSVTTNADLIASSGNIAMKTGKQFYSIDITAGSSTLEEKTSGGPRQMSSMTTLKAKRANLSAAALGWFKSNKNLELIFIVKDRNGFVRLLGDQNQGTFLTEIISNSGAKQGDERGIDFTAEYMGPEALVYGGTIPLTPAS